MQSFITLVTTHIPPNRARDACGGCSSNVAGGRVAVQGVQGVHGVWSSMEHVLEHVLVHASINRLYLALFCLCFCQSRHAPSVRVVMHRLSVSSCVSPTLLIISH